MSNGDEAGLWVAPGAWWLVFGLIWTLVLVALTFLAPYVLVPIFFRPRPLDDPAMVRVVLHDPQKLALVTAVRGKEARASGREDVDRRRRPLAAREPSNRRITAHGQ